MPTDGGIFFGDPADYRFGPGAEIEYQLRLDDGGPPIKSVLLGKFTYDPWLDRVWREHERIIIGGLALLVVLVTSASAFGLILAIAPAQLAYRGGAPELNAVPKTKRHLCLSLGICPK